MLLLALSLLGGGFGVVANARAQNWGRPVDPHRTSAVRAGMLDWPIRGNRTNDRQWMNDHLYCCSSGEGARVLYAGQTPWGALTLRQYGWRHGMHALDADGLGVVPAIPRDIEQVSTIVAMRPENPYIHARPTLVLLVVGRPGTTRVTWRFADWPAAEPLPVPVRNGAGYVMLPWSWPGTHPNDVVITVERRGRVIYDGTVTSLAGLALEYTSESPAPLVELPAALRKTAGERAHAVAFRFCLVSAYDELPGLIANPPAKPTYEHVEQMPHHILRHHLRELALDRTVRSVGPGRVRAALEQPRSATARAVVSRCARYDDIGRT